MSPAGRGSPAAPCPSPPLCPHPPSVIACESGLAKRFRKQGWLLVWLEIHLTWIYSFDFNWITELTAQKLLPYCVYMLAYFDFVFKSMHNHMLNGKYNLLWENVPRNTEIQHKHLQIKASRHKGTPWVPIMMARRSTEDAVTITMPPRNMKIA